MYVKNREKAWWCLILELDRLSAHVTCMFCTAVHIIHIFGGTKGVFVCWRTTGRAASEKEYHASEFNSSVELLPSATWVDLLSQSVDAAFWSRCRLDHLPVCPYNIIILYKVRHSLKGNTPWWFHCIVNRWCSFSSRMYRSSSMYVWSRIPHGRRCQHMAHQKNDGAVLKEMRSITRTRFANLSFWTTPVGL
jgi:hypothetical protein